MTGDTCCQTGQAEEKTLKTQHPLQMDTCGKWAVWSLQPFLCWNMAAGPEMMSLSGDSFSHTYLTSIFKIMEKKKEKKKSPCYSLGTAEDWEGRMWIPRDPPYEVTAPAFLKKKSRFLSHHDVGDFLFPSSEIRLFMLLP